MDYFEHTKNSNFRFAQVAKISQKNIKKHKKTARFGNVLKKLFWASTGETFHFHLRHQTYVTTKAIFGNMKALFDKSML